MPGGGIVGPDTVNAFCHRNHLVCRLNVRNDHRGRSAAIGELVGDDLLPDDCFPGGPVLDPETARELDRQLGLNEAVLRTKLIRPDAH